MTTSVNQLVTPADLDRLRSECRAPVYTPEHPAYADEVSTWNLTVALRPAVVVAAESADDVVRAVRWAGELGLPIGVHATGHGAAPNADGALLISTRRMSEVVVDPEARVATVGAGARMGDVTSAAADHGLAVVQGSSGSTGAVGFTLGGGLGVLSRQFGLAVDHVLTIDVVTADGQHRTVDASHEADLFWALRGGRANLGVVTSYSTALQPLTTLYGGSIFFDGSHARSVLEQYVGLVTGHSDATSSSVAIRRMPPEPSLPEPIRGRMVVQVRLAHVGEAAAGAALAEQVRAFAPSLLDSMTEMPAAALDRIHLDPPHPLPAHDRGCLLDSLPPAAVAAVIEQVTAPDSPLVVVELRPLGGAVSAAPERPSAVPGRAAAFALVAIAPALPELMYTSSQAVQRLHEAVAPWRSPETLPTYLGRSCRPKDVRGAWPATTLDRLLDIKRSVDPANLFRVGHALLSEGEL